MEKKRQNHYDASQKHSNRSVRIISVDKDVQKNLIEIDFSADNLRIRIERSCEPVKEKKQLKWLIFILIAFLLYWTISGNPAMTIDELVVTLLQLIHSI